MLKKYNEYIFAAASEKQPLGDALRKKIILRNSHRDIPLYIAVLNLRSNYFKNTCDGVQFLVHLDVTLSKSVLVQTRHYYLL